jgi:hypothetical protein
LGRHNADFLDLHDGPKTIWVNIEDDDFNDDIPELHIVAFEGVKLGGAIAPVPGRKQ